MPAERRSGGIGAAVAAANERARRSLLRNHGGGHAAVSNLELFFDLVFVFAITQISRALHDHLGGTGLFQGAALFLAVWWAWIYTTWFANWANPDRLPVRLLMLALMLLSLAMAVALPRAFTDLPGLFAASYVAIQLGRSATSALMFHAEGAEGRARTRNMLRIALWFLFTAPLWLAGAMAAPDLRLAWWTAALAVEYTGPMLMFAVPGLGRSRGADWDISGSHMAERCALFIIIALGEGIVITGSSLAALPLEAGRIAAFVLAFLGSALLWWLYFDVGAERGARLIAGHAQAGRVARNAYTYLHMPIVLGVVIGAVGDALLLEHWRDPAPPALILTQTGGMVLYLGGLSVFKRFSNTFGNLPLSHGVAIILFALLGLGAWTLPLRGLDFAVGGVAVLLATAVWEWVSYNGGWIERMEVMGLPYPKTLRTRAEQRRASREAGL